MVNVVYERPFLKRSRGMNIDESNFFGSGEIDELNFFARKIQIMSPKRLNEIKIKRHQSNLHCTYAYAVIERLEFELSYRYS